MPCQQAGDLRKYSGQGKVQSSLDAESTLAIVAGNVCITRAESSQLLLHNIYNPGT